MENRTENADASTSYSPSPAPTEIRLSLFKRGYNPVAFAAHPGRFLVPVFQCWRLATVFIGW
jgi:hypothetical protein